MNWRTSLLLLSKLKLGQAFWVNRVVGSILAMRGCAVRFKSAMLGMGRTGEVARGVEANVEIHICDFADRAG